MGIHVFDWCMMVSERIGRRIEIMPELKKKYERGLKKHFTDEEQEENRRPNRESLKHEARTSRPQGTNEQARHVHAENAPRRAAVQEKPAVETEAVDTADQPEIIPDCCRYKSEERSKKEYRSLVNRLNRIEGQIRGIRKMLDTNVYCIDIMTQVSAVNAALNSFNKVLIANHIETCVTEDIKQGKTEKVEELVKTLPKLMK